MSALAKINHNLKTIKISALLNIYGKYASNEIGVKIIEEINNMWNEPRAIWETKNGKYKIVFEITFQVLEKQEVLKIASENISNAQNFIRIEDKNMSERSMMGYGLGGNSGHWLITDELGESTTAAHEFGHAMGLPHPDHLDYRNTGMPPIMAPRGTIVDSQYQWNPLADAGSYGGTMRPIWRRVRKAEVIAIIENFELSKETTEFRIGRITNTLFDEIGQPVNILY